MVQYVLHKAIFLREVVVMVLVEEEKHVTEG